MGITKNYCCEKCGGYIGKMCATTGSGICNTCKKEHCECVIELSCDICGKMFKRKRTQIRKNKFCSYKCMGSWMSKNRIGIKSSNYKHGKMTNNKRCMDCNKKITSKAKRCRKCRAIQHSKGMKGHKGIHLYGKNNPNWKNGLSRQHYPKAFCNEVKELIRIRDLNTCQLCGKEQNNINRKLSVHHVDYNKNNICLANLISLCSACHVKTNHNRKKWERVFRLKLKKIYMKGEALHIMKQMAFIIHKIRLEKIDIVEEKRKTLCNCMLELCDNLYDIVKNLSE